ncbi:MAG: hypothetical protein M0R48_02310 [Candidatus Omnitrophica bacterium]|jgi:hypothetical protein|nr:hypothetical protein [Candidatus Omnitrophota bacterium]
MNKKQLIVSLIMIGLILVAIFVFLNYEILYGRGLDGKKDLYFSPLSNHPRIYAVRLQIYNFAKYVLPFIVMSGLLVYFLKDKRR